MNSSKASLIRYETELAQEFGKLVARENRLEGLTIHSEARPSEVRLKFDEHQYRFKPLFLLTPTIADIPSADPQSSTQPLLVVPRLTDLFLDACRQNKVSVADLNGQFFLRGPGLLISFPRLPGRNFRFDQEPRNVFVGKSVRIVRSLLSDPERFWQQTDLIKRTGATSGLVSRIVTYLTRQGQLKKVDARRFRVVSHLSLLDAWAEADDFARRATTHRFTALNSDPLELARKIRNVLTHDGSHFAFTQWVAAWLRHPYAEPSVVSLYVPHVPSEDLLAQLGLRSVTDAGRVWFHVPADEGIFREKRFVQELPLVTDAQIYLDLLKTGLRGPEQAQALREWSGFCRP